MKTYLSGIKKRMECVKTLFIPIYSMRSYETGLFDILCDGNMARVLNMCKDNESQIVYVAIPEERLLKEGCIEQLYKFIELHNITDIEFVQFKGYKENAAATRDSVSFNSQVVDFVNKNDISLLVVEPNLLIKHLLLSNNDKIRSLIERDRVIYWCVASATTIDVPWFVMGRVQSDIELSRLLPTACAVESQVGFLKGKSYVEEFYNPENFDMKIIFFPFRISDRSYRFNSLVEMVRKLVKEGIYNFKVLLTDPNNSLEDIEDDIKDMFEVIPSSKLIYLAILKGRPIIPYFENADVVKHISICEMLYYKCNIITFKAEELLGKENVYVCETYFGFYNILKQLLLY